MTLMYAILQNSSHLCHYNDHMLYCKMVLISAITMTLMYVILQNGPHFCHYNDIDVCYIAK